MVADGWNNTGVLPQRHKGELERSQTLEARCQKSEPRTGISPPRHKDTKKTRTKATGLRSVRTFVSLCGHVSPAATLNSGFWILNCLLPPRCYFAPKRPVCLASWWNIGQSVAARAPPGLPATAKMPEPVAMYTMPYWSTTGDG